MEREQRAVWNLYAGMCGYDRHVIIFTIYKSLRMNFHWLRILLYSGIRKQDLCNAICCQVFDIVMIMTMKRSTGNG